MKKAMKGILSSKKGLTAIVAFVAAIGGRFGLDMPIEEVILILTPLMVYIVGQGIADHGKERVKAEHRQFLDE